MLYAALGFWLAIVVLSAWGVHTLWSGMVKPRVVNVALLPGTLVAQMGHVLGLLVSGGTVNNTTLIRDDDAASPQQTPDPKPRIPVIGPVLVGMLPLVFCALAIFLAARYLGGKAVEEMTYHRAAQQLPVSWPAFWDLLRNHINLMEQTFGAMLRLSRDDWRPWVFLYLLVCFCVRMAPFPGSMRGALGAIVIVSILIALLGMMTPRAESFVHDGWGVLSLSVSTLSLLLLFTSITKGFVALVQLLRNNA
jgi:hypothetical protein